MTERTPAAKVILMRKKTHLNYNLANKVQPLTQLEYIHRRLSQIKVHKRKDVNVFCDWVITAPKTLSDDEYYIFFREVFNFMSERYGIQNVVSAYVHMDESQPHMHFAFIPVVKDKKKGIPKLCAKEVITKTELKTIHKDISTHMAKVFGKDIGILNGATALGNMTIEQLKSTSEKAKAAADEIITPKIEEMQKKRSSALGKAFNKEEIVLSGDEITDIQNVFRQAVLAAENADSLSEIKIREKELSELMKKRYRDRMAELDVRENKVRERENIVRDKEISAEDRIRTAEILMNEAKCEKEAAAELISTAEQKQEELSHREDDPHGYYNNVISGLKSEIITRQNIIHKRNMENIELCNKNNELSSENNSLKKELDSLNDEFETALNNTAIDVGNRYENIISEKDDMINSLKKTIEGLQGKIKKFAEIIVNICNAFRSLGHKSTNYDFDKYCADLNDTQYALLDGVCDYAADFEKQEGFEEYSENILTRSGIHSTIKPDVEKLLPDEPKRYYSGYER